MTIEEIKETLPVVDVKVGKNIYIGSISGRKNSFATISVIMPDYNNPFIFNFSWKTVERAINNGTYLTI